MDFHAIFRDKLFAAIVALGAVGFQLCILTIISRAFPASMLANLLIVFLTFLLLTRWIKQSTKVGTIGAVIASAMVALYQCSMGYAPLYGELILLAAGMILMNWLMIRGVMEHDAEYSAEETSWSMIGVSGVLGAVYCFVPYTLLSAWGLTMGTSAHALRYIGILCLLVMVGMFIREFKMKIFKLRLPNETLARFFRVMSTCIVILCVASSIILGYKFLYMYGQNNMMGEPGWQQVYYDDASELFLILGVLVASLALSIGLVAFNTAEAVTASLAAAGAILLLESVTGNFVLTIQQFLVNSIIFCLSALMVLESKGETLWE